MFHVYNRLNVMKRYNHFNLLLCASELRAYRFKFRSSFLFNPSLSKLIPPQSLITYRFCGQFRSLKLSSKMPLVGVKDDWSFKLQPKELLEKTSDIIEKCTKLYDSVGNIPESDVSYETVLKVLKEADCEMANTYLQFPKDVSHDESLRNASTEADHKLKEFSVEIGMRKDVFQKLLILEKKKEPLKYEDQRYLDKCLLLGKRNGLYLDDVTQKRVKDLNTEISKISIDFMKNLNNVTTTLNFSDEELDGVPTDFLKSLKRNPDTGKAEVTLKYPHYFTVMKKCRIPETRRKLEFAFNTQCLEENSPILTELRKLRHEAALLLGYPSHASYKTETLMSKSAKNVQKFLTELADKLKPVYMEEKKYLLDLKEKECAELDIPFDQKLNSWDLAYYSEMTSRIKYAVDHTKLREYFPLPIVKKGLLDIYQDLLGLKFEQVEGEVWHEDVEMHSVKDASSGVLLGYFFLDLFPRSNKYGHAALFPLQDSYLRPDGTHQVAIAAMVSNFTKPTADKPALLDHDEVKTFFHEFGHVMHYICIHSEYPLTRFGNFNLEMDFIEVPSQMLENWCWEKAPLKMMSSHYLSNNAIPEDMLDALINSRLANVSSFNLRQIVLAQLDQRIHSSLKGDTREIYTELMKELMGIEPQAGTNFACYFRHLAAQYDAQYYGYLWSEVYSMDMFQTRFARENILNPEVGKDYRDKILKPGASKDPMDLIVGFLGRKPTQDAFLRSKGLKL